jgi:F0F1-type ATP synthase assembly protein I
VEDLALIVHLGGSSVNMSRTFLSDSGQANKALQQTLDKNEPRIVASYALIGAILLLGGIGYAVDCGTSPWFVLAGLSVGILFGVYNLVSSLRR